MLPFHSPEPDLESLSSNWNSEYPPHSHPQKAILQILIQADYERLRSDSALEQLELDLYLTGLPLHHWDRRTHNHVRLLQRRQSRAFRRFSQALKLLQSSGKPLSSPARKDTAASALAEPEPVPPPNPVYVRQSAEIKIVDGRVVTKCECPARFYLDRWPWPLAAGFCRQFYFPQAFVPEEYAYVLTDEAGVTHPPRAYLSIFYSTEEFYRMCQLEVETGSEHLLPGECLRIEHHN